MSPISVKVGQTCRLALVRRVLLLLMMLAPAPVLAFQEDVHFDATFALALAIGWNWEDARTIASADQGIDENLDTQPSVLGTETGKNDPRPNAGQTQAVLELYGLGIQLKLTMQDYAFHCFSRHADTKGRRNQDVIGRMGTLEAEAIRAIDIARQRTSKGNDARALIAIGIYLHCLQDSWSHSGYGAEPLGHVKDGTVPDSPAKNAEMGQRALSDTAARLKFFLERRVPYAAKSFGPKVDGLIKGLTTPIAGTLSDAERIRCNRRLVEHWLFVVVNADGRIAEASIAPRARSRAVMLRLMKLPNLREPQKGNTIAPPLKLLANEPDPCDMVFVDMFPEVLKNIKRAESSNSCLLSATWPCDPVEFDDIEMPTPRYPLLKLSPTLLDPIKDESTGAYDLK